MDPISPEIMILLSIGPPGTKRSHFCKAFESILKREEFGYDKISLRAIKKECAENFAKSNQEKKFTSEQLRMYTAKDAEGLFKARLGKLIKTAALTKKKAHFIYINRDHLPDMLPRSLKLIKEYSEDINVKIVALVPELKGMGISYEIRGKEYFNPFSLNFIFAGFGQALKETHEMMLNGVMSKSTKAFLYFLNLFANFPLSEYSILHKGFDKVFYVPLVNEQSPLEIPDELVQVLVSTLKSCEPGRDNFNQDCLEQLEKIYEEPQVPFRLAKKQTIENSIMKFLEVEVYPEILSKENKENDVLEPSESIVLQEQAQPAQRKLTKIELRRQEKERKRLEKMIADL